MHTNTPLAVVCVAVVPLCSLCLLCVFGCVWVRLFSGLTSLGLKDMTVNYNLTYDEVMKHEEANGEVQFAANGTACVDTGGTCFFALSVFGCFLLLLLLQISHV